MKPYEKYKKSGVEWIGEIPEHWNNLRIKYLVNGGDTLFIDGNWIESDIITEDGIRYLTSGNIGPGFYKEQGNGFVSEDTFISNSFTEVFPGDLLISRLNEPIGRACIIPDLGNRIVTCVDNVILRPKTTIDKRYLMFLMNSKEYSNVTSLISRGATMKRISRSLLGQIKIPIPPKAEQTTIAKYLDHQTAIIDELIEKKTKQIALLKEKRQAIINETVTKGLDPTAKMKDSGLSWLGEIPASWEIVALRHLSTKIGSGVTPKGGADVYTEEGVIFIRSQNVHFDGLRLDDVVRIEQETHEKMSGSQVMYKDVLLNITGASIGRCSVVNIQEEMNVNQHVCIIRPNNKISSEYLNLVLQSNVGQTQVKTGTTGGNREGLTFEAIKEFIVPVPALESQFVIVSKIEKLLKQFQNLESKNIDQIEKLKEYRQSLISEAVTGKIDVRGWQK